MSIDKYWSRGIIDWTIHITHSTLYSSLPSAQATAAYHQLSNYRRRIKTEEKAKVVATVWGTELIQFHAELAIFHKDDLKKRMNRTLATWRNGCLGKMDDHPVHTLPKWMYPKNVCSNHPCY